MKYSFLTRFVLPVLIIAVFAACSGDKKKEEKTEQVKNEQKSQDGWIDLFDGKTLNGWGLKEAEAHFYVKDGMIVGDADYKTPNCYLVTDQLFDNFILELDFKVDSPLNSGVQIRSKEWEKDTTIMYRNGGDLTQSPHKFTKGTVVGYQIEIDPSDRAWTGGLYEVGGRGWLVPLKDNPEAGKAYKKDDWNHFRIIADGNHIQTWINGVKAVDTHDDLWKTGFIGFQMHGVYDESQVGKKMYFKNIRLKKL